MGGVLSTIKDNWAVIKQAPWAFGAVTLLILAIVWFAFKLLKGEQIASLEGRLKLRDDEIADYKRKLSGASPDEAAARIDALEREVENLRPKQRALSPAQRAKLIETTKGRAHEGSKIEVIYAKTSHEAAVFSEDICEALREAGWDVRADHVIAGAYRLKERGLTLAVHNKQKLSPMTVALKEGLEAAGLPFQWVQQDGIQSSGRLYVDLAE